jgi:hypothetical protein
MEIDASCDAHVHADGTDDADDIAGAAVAVAGIVAVAGVESVAGSGWLVRRDNVSAGHWILESHLVSEMAAYAY